LPDGQLEGIGRHWVGVSALGSGSSRRRPEGRSGDSEASANDFDSASVELSGAEDLKSGRLTVVAVADGDVADDESGVGIGSRDESGRGRPKSGGKRPGGGGRLASRVGRLKGVEGVDSGLESEVSVVGEGRSVAGVAASESLLLASGLLTVDATVRVGSEELSAARNSGAASDGSGDSGNTGGGSSTASGHQPRPVADQVSFVKPETEWAPEKTSIANLSYQKPINDNITYPNGNKTYT